jgi:hypothetical protein
MPEDATAEMLAFVLAHMQPKIKAEIKTKS